MCVSYTKDSGRSGPCATRLALLRYEIALSCYSARRGAARRERAPKFPRCARSEIVLRDSLGTTHIAMQHQRDDG